MFQGLAKELEATNRKMQEVQSKREDTMDRILSRHESLMQFIADADKKREASVVRFEQEQRNIDNMLASIGADLDALLAD